MGKRVGNTNLRPWIWAPASLENRAAALKHRGKDHIHLGQNKASLQGKSFRAPTHPSSASKPGQQMPVHTSTTPLAKKGVPVPAGQSWEQNWLLETHLHSKLPVFFQELEMCFPPRQTCFYSNQYQPFCEIFAFLHLFPNNKAVRSFLELVFLFYLVNIFKHHYCYNKC